MAIDEIATLDQWLDFHAEEQPEKIAISQNGTDVNYGELQNKTKRFAGGLKSLGLQKGDIVALQLPNILEFVIAFLAVTRCGGVVQMLHMPYQQAERRQLLAHSEAKMVICLANAGDKNPASDMLALVAELDRLETIISVGQAPEGTLNFEELLKAEAYKNSPPVGPDDPFLLLYTSGTTASPKGVPHNYRGFLGNARRSAFEFNLATKDRLMSAAPFTHLYGLYVLHLTLFVGAGNILLPVFDPATFLETLESEQPTALFSAPAHFAPFVANGLLGSDHISSIGLLCLSGAPVAPELAQAIDGFLDTGDVIQLWGMSELQAGSFGRPGDLLSKRMGTAGRAAPETLLRVVDSDGNGLKSGEEGELQVKGPSVFSGYLRNRSETKAAFTKDGWFKTGDLAQIDEEGFLTLSGRIKEIINRGGIKYNPIDIELLIMKNHDVEACAIVPYPDAVLGERACLFVSLKAECSLNLDEVCHMLEDNGVAKYKWPERIEVVDSLPMTPTRKVMRGELKKKFVEQ